MNRHIRHTILLTLAIVVMAACGGGGSDVPSPAPTPTPTPTPTNPTNPDPEPTPIPTPQPAEPQPVAIGFRADLSDAVATTRSAGDGEYNNTMLQRDGFGVYCWYTGTAPFTTPKASTNMLMRNQKVEWKSPKWDYSPSKYWPLNTAEFLTFRAYVPYTDYMVTDNDGTPSLPVVVKATDYAEGSQHDPLFGTDIHGKKYTDVTYMKSGDDLEANDSHDGTIHWFFHHGMAKLVFNARLEDTSGDAEVYITKISISPLYTQGLLSIDSQSDTTYIAGTHDIDKITKPNWSDRSGAMTVNLQGWNGTKSVDLDNYTIYRDHKNDQGNPVYETLTNPGLLIIPRDYEDALNKRLIITVSYKRNKNDNNSNEFTVTTTIPTQSFKGNTVYKLNLTVGSALVADIESVNVATTTNWNEKEGEHEVYNW